MLHPKDAHPPEHGAPADHQTRPVRSLTGPLDAATTVRKVCAYVTRNRRELLVFDGPGHDAPQVPKGTIEGTEPPRQALDREIHEESGLRPDEEATHLASDIWMRRRHPPRHYIRHFYHVSVDDPRDAWTHVVTGAGPEQGCEFEYTWVPLDDATALALDLDDYVPLLGHRL